MVFGMAKNFILFPPRTFHSSIHLPHSSPFLADLKIIPMGTFLSHSLMPLTFLSVPLCPKICHFFFSTFCCPQFSPIFSPPKMPVERSFQQRNGLFRRAQSLRFPRSSVAAASVPPSANSSACTSPCATSASHASNFSRTGSRAYRSKSSRHRLGSLEAQSLLGRMSAGQRLALSASWRQMRHQMPALVRKILVELEQQEPVVKQIFYKASYVDCFASASSSNSAVVANLATMDEHVRLMAKFFDELVAFVETAGPGGTEGGEEITAMIKRLGQQHAILAHSAGLSAEVWERLGEIAMERLCAVEVVQKTREAGRAWRTLIAFLTDKIRCGFEGEAKVFSRRPSTDQQAQTAMIEDEQEAPASQGPELPGAGGGGGEPVVALGLRLQQLRAECGWEGTTPEGTTTGSSSTVTMINGRDNNSRKGGGGRTVMEMGK